MLQETHVAEPDLLVIDVEGADDGTVQDISAQDISGPARNTRKLSAMIDNA
ncbi:DUF6207 family protein [Streptomyces sp. NPDC059866]|uniref:DUF6207 family protein n=1 Tax=Streptomyces sp. NPDC059866 TaxID=3346978 RepID=UPI00364862A3